MKRGTRLAQEREYGRPRSFAEIVREEPSLQALQLAAVKATMTQRTRRQVWRRTIRWMVMLLITLALLALWSAPLWLSMLRPTRP